MLFIIMPNIPSMKYFDIPEKIGINPATNPSN